MVSIKIQRVLLTKPMVVVYVAFILSILPRLTESQVSSIQSNECESEVEGRTVYSACSSQPARLFSGSAASSYTVDVSPEDFTCGVTSIDDYCTLGSITTCDVCNGASELKRHPPDLMIDRSSDRSHLNSYWQSITWAGPLNANAEPTVYPAPLEVNITISFNKSYELQSDIKITFFSSRPASMRLEKSSDYGETWELWQTFRRRCSGPSFVPKEQPDTTICTQRYSQLLPYSYGVVVFDVIADRFIPFLGAGLTNYESLYEAYDNTKLQEFLTFTDIRIVLLQPMTDGAEVSGNFQDLIKYYYSISDIEVTASCSCNLHAKFCVRDGDSVRCNCEHNTDGISCERCKRLYNNKPWMPGLHLPYPMGTANPCEKCECNDHADSCTYNSTLEMGVCDDCYHNTTGVHCQNCVPTFYKNDSVLSNHPDICLACECELLGVQNNNTECDQVTGQCDCKSEVTGRRCDACKDQYYGLLQEDSPGTCKECECEIDGTFGPSNVCDKQTGQCPCKSTTTGRMCNTCKDGFWNFPTMQTFRECDPCNCNQGGSMSLVCDKITGQCPCHQNVTGKLCDDTPDGFFTPSLDHFQYQPRGGTCKLMTGLISEENPFTGAAYMLCEEAQYVTFEDIAGDTTQHELEWTYLPAVRYHLQNTTESWAEATLQFTVAGLSFVDTKPYGEDVSSNCPTATGTTSEFQLLNLEPGVGMARMVSSGNLTVDVRCKYSITLTATSRGDATSQEIAFDSVVLFPHPNAGVAAIHVSPEALQTCIEGTAALNSRDLTLADPECSDIAFIVMSQLFSGSDECNCDPVGSLSEVCSPAGGACQCKAGVYGRKCDQCAPGYYNYTQDGCTACACQLTGSSSPVCDAETGQCPCLPNVALQGQQNSLNLAGDLRCTACLKDNYGLSSGEGCLPCDCDLQGSNSSQCSEGGVCDCKDTVTGDKCDTCEPGYFSRTQDGCLPCGCTETGSVGLECDQASGECMCKANVLGEKCDTCKPNSFNLNTLNPDGCQNCFCYGHGAVCSPATGFTAYTVLSEDTNTNWTAVDAEDEGDVKYRQAPAHFTGDKHLSYAQPLRIEIRTRADVEIPLDSKPVILTGNGKRVYYNKTGFLVTNTFQTLEVILHESYFYYNATSRPDYFNFYAILANLEALYIRRKFGVESVELVNITMKTAVEITSADDVEVTFVENCTCESTRNVAGLSCESCSQGFRRSRSGVGLYDTCVECDCNSRGETTPPLCDMETGVCLNCRNGTLGDQCESCAPFVDAASDCTQCEDGYWGLSQDGCQACGCDVSSSVSPVCDKTTGMCDCKPNVVGDLCNECADNFYDRTTTGCIECDTCYGLVMQEVVDLREMKDNLTAVLEQLQLNDNNTRLGAFAHRLQSTMEDMGQLSLFLVEANNVQDPVSQAISSLNNTLVSLQSQLDINATTTLDEANATLELTGQTLSQVDLVRQQITGSINSTYAVLTQNEKVSSTELTGAVESLQTTNQTIYGATNTTVEAVTGLTAVALEVHSKSAQAKTVAEATLQTVTDTIAAHNADAAQTTSFELTAFSSLTTTLDDVSTKLKGNEDATQEVTEENNRLLESLNNIETIDTDISSLMGQSQGIAEAAGILTEKATSFTEEELDIMNVRVVKSQESLSNVSQQVSTLASESLNIYNELSTLHTNATLAKNQTEQSFLDAASMLDIVTNFEDKATAVESQVTESLDTVQEVTATSLAATESARSKRSSLETALTNSQVGLAGVQIAEARAAANLQIILPLGGRANEITNKAASNLSRIESDANSVLQSNQTKVQPAQQACNLLEPQVTSLETDSTVAFEKARNLSTVINNTDDRLQVLLQEIQDVGSINTDKIAELRNFISQAKADFDRRQLSTAVENLRNQVESQREWLDNMRARKQEMQAQILRLKAVRAQLSP